MSQAGIDAIALSIPIFFLLIGIEIWIERRERRSGGKRSLYRLNDTLNDLGCGTIQQLVGVFAKTALFAGYVLLYERVGAKSPTALSMGEWSHWLAAFLGV